MTEYPPNKQEPQNVYGSYAQAYGQGLPDHMEAPEKPQQLQVAVWVSYAIAAFGLISLALYSIFTDEINQGVMESLNTAGLANEGLSAEEMAATQDLSSGLFAGIAIFSAVFGLIINLGNIAFTVFMGKGANWARIVLTVYAAMTAFDLLTIGGWFLYFHWTMLLSPLRSILAITFLIVAWQGPVSDYMRRSKAYKAWQAQNPSA